VQRLSRSPDRQEHEKPVNCSSSTILLDSSLRCPLGCLVATTPLMPPSHYPDGGVYAGPLPFLEDQTTAALMTRIIHSTRSAASLYIFAPASRDDGSCWTRNISVGCQNWAIASSCIDKTHARPLVALTYPLAAGLVKGTVS
jgi:hypothetical protein